MKNMHKRAAMGLAGLLVVAGVMCAAVPTVSAAGETFKVVSVNMVGCASGGFNMNVERANLDGGVYTVRTVVSVDNLIYMNEAASITVNGPSLWGVFNNFSYGAVPNPGTYPIPSDRPMLLSFSLERPKGNVLYAWTLVVDGCNTGNIVLNGPTADLGVVLTAAAGPFAPGATVPLTVEVVNNGVVDAPNAEVVVTLPPQFVAGVFSNLTVTGPGPAPYTCSVDVTGRVLTCAVASHPVGATATLAFGARMGPSVPAAGEQVTVRADVSSDGVDLRTVNDSSTVVISVPTFVSITPTRVVDTRSSLGVLTEAVAAGSTIKIPITALDEIPDGATSVVVNLTSTRIQDAGFLTLHACTTPRPNTSNSNYRPGADTANLTISTIGTDGAICLYTSAATDLIVDVVAYTTAGFIPTAPQRLTDTRAGTAPAADTTIRVPLPAGSTHVINVTSTRSTAAGFLTAFDCDLPRPTTSHLNYAAGVDIANLTIASADTELCVYTSLSTDIVVDHLGTMSNATSALARLVDTRTIAPAIPGTVIHIPTIATTNPTAAINLTATRTTTAGFLTVHACNQPVPTTSNLNVTPGRDIANLAIIPTSTPMCVTVNANTDVIIDLQTTII
jgi:hypothetical protein